MCFNAPKVPEIPPPAPPPTFNPQLAPQLRDQTPEARRSTAASSGLALQPRLDLLIPTSGGTSRSGLYMP